MQAMNTVVTGGAGFIGSHVVDRLLAMGSHVTCLDNLSLGSMGNIEQHLVDPRFKFIEVDLCQLEKLEEIFQYGKFDAVFHLAANSDIQRGGQEPDIDFRNTFLTTRNILEMMRIHQVKTLFFASTSAVYGEKSDIALTEDMGDLMPVSYYGGAKLASEALISSYTFMNEFKTLTFRFPNVIGPRLTHGVIFDFIKKLRRNSTELEILGDGKQSKPYIYISDLIDVIQLMMENIETGFNIYNVGVDTATSVTKIADLVTEIMELRDVKYTYTGGKRGWQGDVPRFAYDLTKIRQFGWRPVYTSDEAVSKTIQEVI